MSTDFKTVLDQALEYAARGWPVVPVHGIREDGRCDCGAMDRTQEVEGWRKHTPGKEPYVSVKDASKEPSQIYLWWQMYPNANVAIATGVRSGLVVLDIDAAHQGDPEFDGYLSLARLERQYGKLPPTLTAKSGGGGTHYYFQYPGRMDLRGRRGMRPSIDVRAADTKILAPPSKHVTGPRYEWVTPLDTPIAPLPRWLLMVIQTKNKPVKRKVKQVPWL